MRRWLSSRAQAPAELPLRRDDTTRFMPWIIAVMVFLMALALAAALGIKGAMAEWNQQLGATLTVQIPVPLKRERDNGDQRVEKALKILRSTPGVAAAEAVDQREVKDLLETWLGKGNVVPELPVPRLIDVSLEPDIEVNLTDLEQRVALAVPGATLDDHKLWLANLLELGDKINYIALGVLALIAFAGLAVVTYATRSGLITHNRTIELLHIMGAPDSYIAARFAWHILGLSLLGGILGLALASLVAFIVYQAADNLGEAMFPLLTLNRFDLAALALLPLGVAAFTMLAAAATVLRRLQRLA
ncbi:MAG: cell division protein FtsX [Dongiaceae bacterium]